MAENYWICAKCGHHNSMRDHRCAVCHHKMTTAEKNEALQRVQNADNFDRMMNRRFGSSDSDETYQRRAQPQKRRRQNRNTISERFRQMGQDIAIDPRQPFYLKVIHVIVHALLIISIAVFAYSFFVYVTNGYFDGLTTAASKLGSSVVNIFSNTYNYFLNINFSNNALVRVGSIIGGNLVKMVTTIFSNIASLFGK